MKMKQWLKSAGLALAATFMLGAQLSPVFAAETTKVKVVSIGSDAQVWKYIAEQPEVKEAGIELVVEEINGGVELNNAVADGVADANAFQSIGYLDFFNKDAKEKLVPIGTTYIEPMGLYSKKYKELKDVPEGATILIPSDPANMARALRLLEAAEFIKLSATFDDASGTEADIVENTKKVQFKTAEDTTIVRALEDVDAGIVGNTVALEGNLNVLTDSLFKEEVGEKTKSRINIVAVKKGRENDENLKKLVDFYHLPKVQAYIKKEFQGTKVEVTKPIKEVWSGQ